MRAERLRIAVWSVLAQLAGGCSGGNSIAPVPPVPACVPLSTPEFAYVLNGTSVSMYTVNSCTGELTPTTPATVATGATPQQIPAESMVVDPAGKFVYVANLVSNATDAATISMYTVSAGTGVLNPTNPAAIHTGFFPQGIGIHPSGKFVYTANSDENTVSMFAVDSDTGLLVPTTPTTVASGWSPLSVTVHPSGKFAYVANQDDDTVSMYTVDSTTGVLTPMAPATVPTGISPFGLTIDPSGKFAYVPDAYDSRNVLSQYTIDLDTGVLTPDNPATVTSGNQPTAVTVDPSGKFAYVTNRLDNSISVFAIDSTTGNLAFKSIIQTGTQPYRITFDPSGKFVYVANEGSGVAIYALGADGSLASAGQALPGTASTVAVVIAPHH